MSYNHFRTHNVYQPYSSSSASASASVSPSAPSTLGPWSSTSGSTSSAITATAAAADSDDETASFSARLPAATMNSNSLLSSSPAASSSTSCEVRTFTGNAVASHVLTRMLFGTDPLFDVTVHAGGREFRCHRAVLAASSPVFLAMFRSSMLEPSTGVLRLPSDVSASVFEALRSYLYGQPLKVRSDDAVSLSTFVRRYDIATRELEPFLDNLLASALTLDNVMNIRAHADVHGAHRLRRACDRFVTARMHLLPFSRPFLDAAPHDAEASLQAPSRVARDSVPPRCAERVFAAAVAWLTVEDDDVDKEKERHENGTRTGNGPRNGRARFRDRILSTIPLDQLSLPALVRASRDPIVSASEEFKSRLLRTFAVSVERCMALASPPAAAEPTCGAGGECLCTYGGNGNGMGNDRERERGAQCECGFASNRNQKCLQRSALDRLHERDGGGDCHQGGGGNGGGMGLGSMSMGVSVGMGMRIEEKYQQLYRYRHAAAIASRLQPPLHHYHHHHQHFTPDMPFSGSGSGSASSAAGASLSAGNGGIGQSSSSSPLARHSLTHVRRRNSNSNAGGSNAGPAATVHVPPLVLSRFPREHEREREREVQATTVGVNGGNGSSSNNNGSGTSTVAELSDLHHASTLR